MLKIYQIFSMEEHADAREMTVYRLTLGLGILKEMNSSLIVWKK
jgi:hypothetical protein